MQFPDASEGIAMAFDVYCPSGKPVTRVDVIKLIYGLLSVSINQDDLKAAAVHQTANPEFLMRSATVISSPAAGAE